MKCSRCLEEKPISEFYAKKKKRKGGGPLYGSWCKTCLKIGSLERYRSKSLEETREIRRRRKEKTTFESRKDQKLRWQYGITLEEYQKMLEEQGNACFICKIPFNGQSYRVDHCHKTGKVRKILCHKCNSAIGFLNEDIDIFNRCIEYLKYYDHPQENTFS